MNKPRDRMMEEASRALVAMEYLRCERLCLAALADAREQQDWVDYARILLPLQEVRRQRRMIASEGTQRLGSSTLTGEPLSWLKEMGCGSLVLTAPHGVVEARLLVQAIDADQLHAEILLVEGALDGAHWCLRSFTGPPMTVQRPAPPPAWRERWLWPGESFEAENDPLRSQTPSDWVLSASEALGDAAIAAVTAPLGSLERIVELEAMLAVVPDHEKLHQRLGEAARARGRRGDGR